MEAKEIMRSVIILTFLAALFLASAGCKQDRETRIRGKVVTFREDSLLWDGDVEVSLYPPGSFFDPPMERKNIGPPYSFSFVIKGWDDDDEWFDFWGGFQVAVEKSVPGHAAAGIAGVSDEVPPGTDVWRVISLMPRTCVAFHLISDSLGDYIYIGGIELPNGPGGYSGGLGFSHNSFPPNDTVYHCFYWNGETPIRYVTYSDGVEITQYDTLYTSPFDTTYHKIVY